MSNSSKTTSAKQNWCVSSLVARRAVNPLGCDCPGHPVYTCNLPQTLFQPFPINTNRYPCSHRLRLASAAGLGFSSGSIILPTFTPLLLVLHRREDKLPVTASILLFCSCLPFSASQPFQCTSLLKYLRRKLC